MVKKILLFFLFTSNFILAQNEIKHEVYFDTNKFLVLETEQNRLVLFIQEIQKENLEKISIYGFCDDIGSNSYNLALSQQRADAIRSIFSEHEIDSSLIHNVDGKGEVFLKIIDTKDANTIRGLNRKVEIIASFKEVEKVEKLSKKPDIENALEGKLSIGDKVVLENILFKTGYSYMLPESEKTLKKVAEILQERNDLYFTIQGHVCCTQYGRDAVDRKTKKRNLSVARAKYIYYYLAKNGVAKKRMKYVGLGHKFPLGGEAKFDRRVEIVITKITSK